MGWREDQWAELQGVIANLEHKPVADAVIMATLRRVSEALRADIPTADRIAFARELLAGTGRVDARDVGQRISYRRPREPLNYQDGWNACRAAMLAPDDASG